MQFYFTIRSIFAGRKEEQVMLHELGGSVAIKYQQASTPGLGSIE